MINLSRQSVPKLTGITESYIYTDNPYQTIEKTAEILGCP